MDVAAARNPTRSTSLRLWPGILAVSLQWAARFVLPLFNPDFTIYGILGAMTGGLAVLLWWLFFSRAPWVERLVAIPVVAAALFVTSFLVHPSIANGMMGMMLPINSIPFLSLALVAGAAAGRGLSSRRRPFVTAAAVVLACGGFTLVRTGGITGEGASELHWRWTRSPEERLLAAGSLPSLGTSRRANAVSSQPPSAAAPGGTAARSDDAQRDIAASAPPSRAAAAEAPAARDIPDAESLPGEAEAPKGAASPREAGMAAEWPGFRGPARDGVVHGVHVETDWAAMPPRELWRQPIGPGWSSFAVRGDRVYTQEQRGEHELVSSYRLATGEPVWSHQDAVRFWESNGGAGPRATPTVHDGRVYTLGATGIVNALDAETGAVVWSHDAASETGTEVPGWGFAGSPLVVDGVVVVALSGRLVAYDAVTGERRWVGSPEGAGYSSPHLVTIAGVPQIVLLRGRRSTSVSPRDGTLLWEDSWQPGVSIVQPAVIENGDVLVAAGDAMGGLGLRRLAVARTPAGWSVAERWTSRGLKPYFNDFVVHDGHAYGFDGSILASIDLRDGTRTWKGGRYGHGQLLLLADQGVLLVLSEEGELALVKAAPDRHTELARFKAIEGKTWNHPVLVKDILLVRNGEEMAAFRLPLRQP